MRDGVTLLADHYAPTGAPSHGTILVRSPYGRSGAAVPAVVTYGRIFAERGYHVLWQSCRGTFGSSGDFEPMVHEADDAHDTVSWLRDQPWFEGRLATVGASYAGYTQWALLTDPPPELVTAVITVGPHDLSASLFGSGAFHLNDFLLWSDTVAHQEEDGLVGGLWRRAKLAAGGEEKVSAAE